MTVNIADRGYLMNANEIWQLCQEAGVKYRSVISTEYLQRSLDVVYSALEQWPRVYAQRVDLRFADDRWGGDPDLPTCFQRAEPQAISRFIDSFKSQLREEHRRKGWLGIPSSPCYVWVREQDCGYHPHYHLVLFFNKDDYAFLGDYTNHDANNMATRIQKAWCSALSLPFPYYASLVHFPANSSYAFTRKTATTHSESYRAFLLRIAYLCKVRTKPVGDRWRNFGCSMAESVALPTDGIIGGL